MSNFPALFKADLTFKALKESLHILVFKLEYLTTSHVIPLDSPEELVVLYLFIFQSLILLNQQLTNQILSFLRDSCGGRILQTIL